MTFFALLTIACIVQVPPSNFLSANVNASKISYSIIINFMDSQIHKEKLKT